MYDWIPGIVYIMSAGSLCHARVSVHMRVLIYCFDLYAYQGPRAVHVVGRDETIPK